MSAATDYYDKTQQLLANLRATQLRAIERAAELCAERIAHGGLVFLFGAGHSRMMCEEMALGAKARGHPPVMLPSHQFVGMTTADATEKQLEAYSEGYRRRVAHLYA